MTEPRKHRVLVTGAVAGLGLSLVKRFLKGAYEVFAWVQRPATVLNDLVREYDDSLKLISLNMADMDAVCDAARQIREFATGLDLIINNAGIHLDHAA